MKINKGFAGMFLKESSAQQVDVDYKKLADQASKLADLAWKASRVANDSGKKRDHEDARKSHKAAVAAYDDLDKYRRLKRIDLHLTGGNRAFDHNQSANTHQDRAADADR